MLAAVGQRETRVGLARRGARGAREHVDLARLELPDQAAPATLDVGHVAAGLVGNQFDQLDVQPAQFAIHVAVVIRLPGIPAQNELAGFERGRHLDRLCVRRRGRGDGRRAVRVISGPVGIRAGHQEERGRCGRGQDGNTHEKSSIDRPLPALMPVCLSD